MDAFNFVTGVPKVCCQYLASSHCFVCCLLLQAAASVFDCVEYPYPLFTVPFVFCLKAILYSFCLLCVTSVCLLDCLFHLRTGRFLFHESIFVIFHRKFQRQKSLHLKIEHYISHLISFSVKERCRLHHTNKHVQRIEKLVSGGDGVLLGASVRGPED